MTRRNEITIIVSLKWYSCARRTFSVGAKERNDLNMANMKKEYKMSAERKEELQKEQQKKSRLVLMIPHLAAFTRQIYSYCGAEKEPED